jgi:hypothetical protein
LFGAMRRALVLAGVMLVALLAMGQAASARHAGGDVERELVFELPAEGGFLAAIQVSDYDGEAHATLIVRKGLQEAYYEVPAKVTAKRVTARFGSLGKLDFSYAPKRNGKFRCTGAEEGEATFDGTFTFTGENEYVHLEAGHAEGSFQAYPEQGCRQSGRPRRAVPYHPSYSSEGATLEATAGSREQGQSREVSIYDPGPKARGRARGAIFGSLWEEREGMIVSRGAGVPLRAGSFGWSLGKGTATLRAQAPFTGSAHFVRHGNNGHGTWTGSLSVPILGGEPIELAGNEFHAYMHKGVPQDE